MTYKILIAEDEDIISDAFKLGIELNCPGVHVDVVKDGQSLLDKLNSEDYQLVLSDNDMPRLTGLSALKRLKGNNRSPENYYIISGHLTESEEKEAIRLGAKFVRKPIRLAELANLVKTAQLDYKNTRREGTYN